MLVRSGDPAAARAAADAVARAPGALPEVGEAQGPADAAELADRRRAHAARRRPAARRPRRTRPTTSRRSSARSPTCAAEHPGVSLRQAGAGTGENEFTALLEEDLGKAGMLSLPVTVDRALIAFGAIVAAFVPLLLGLTSVAAAMGAFGVVSQFAPDGGSTGALVLLIGLAVAVDYSLFYIRREREERRAGRGPEAALDIAAATAGRAIVVSGLTVMVSLAGLLITGLSVFTSMALGTIVVVAIAVLGSLTVLPATLALLGDRIDRGRLPFPRRRAPRARPRPLGARRARASRAARRRGWSRRCACSARSPLPAVEMKTRRDALPRDLPVVQADARDRARVPRRARGRPARRHRHGRSTTRGPQLDGARASARSTSPAAAARCASTVAAGRPHRGRLRPDARPLRRGRGARRSRAARRASRRPPRASGRARERS